MKNERTPRGLIMVDELMHWPGSRAPFHRGSCHLTTTGAIEDLHVFARRIGMRRSWFQNHRSAPHYDLTPARREAALRAGAVFVPAKEQARARRNKRPG